MTPISRIQDLPDVYTDINGLNHIKQGNDDLEALRKVSKQFESMFINMMLKNMRQANAAFEEGNIFNSNESRMYRDMYDNQLSLNLANGNGIGVAETLFNQLKDSYGRALGLDEEGEEQVVEIKEDWRRQSDVLVPVSLSEKHRPFPGSAKPDVSAGDDRENGSLGLQGANTGVTNSTANKKADISLEGSSFNAPSFNGPSDFVEKLYPVIKQAVSKFGFHPLAVLAQSALETGWGKHVIAERDGESSFNLFNIKADTRWAGKSVSVNTLEFKGGLPVQEKANFRHYDSFEQSIQDYLSFLDANPRYESALGVKNDPQAYLAELQNAGYATDPLYAEKVLDVLKKIQPLVDSPTTNATESPDDL